MFYEKFKKWIKKNWEYVLAFIAFLIGFITGRKSLRLSNSNDGESEQYLIELREQLSKSRENLIELEREFNIVSSKLKLSRDENLKIGGELNKLREQFNRTEKYYINIKESNGKSKSDINKLKNLNNKTRETIERYREELKNIELHN